MSYSNPMHKKDGASRIGWTYTNGQKAEDAPDPWPFGTIEPPRGDDAPWPKPPSLDDLEKAPF